MMPNYYIVFLCRICGTGMEVGDDETGIVCFKCPNNTKHGPFYWEAIKGYTKVLHKEELSELGPKSKAYELPIPFTPRPR